MQLKEVKNKYLTMLLVLALIISGGFPIQNTLATAVKAAEEEEGSRQVQEPIFNDKEGVVTWDCVYFGRYRTGSSQENIETEPIKWRVLAVQDQEALLISDSGLDAQPYCPAGRNATWENSTLRSWLNGYDDEQNLFAEDYSTNNFISAAFNEDEVAQMRVIKRKEGEKDGKDRVSLLSSEDLESSIYGFSPTLSEYSNRKTRVIENDNESILSWWLRDDLSSGMGSYVGETGSVYKNNGGKKLSVRPVIRLNLQSDVWSKAESVSIKIETGDRTLPGKPVVDEESKTVTWDCVYFGNYYQNDENTREPIKWRVLSVDGADAYLIADQNLDYDSYHFANTDDARVKWENCTLRSWLNGYSAEYNLRGWDYSKNNFLDIAFGKEEQLGIINIDDRISLLSKEEIRNAEYGFLAELGRYREARATDNAAYLNGESDWWLRDSLGTERSYVDEEGMAFFYSDSLDPGRSMGVRPTLHLDLENSSWYRAESVTAGMIGNPIVDKEKGVTTWDCIYFGQYYQDEEDRKDPIKWRVLSVDGNDAFLLADQNLDCGSYHDSQTNVSWEICSLRHWLNNTFLNEAFSQKEQAVICDTNVMGSDSETEKSVTDKIYLLSVDEASNAKYGFLSDFEQKSDTRIASNTAYLEKVNPLMHGKDDAEWWWLRTLGSDAQNAVYVGGDGRGYLDGEDILRTDYAVRPVLHISLKDVHLWSMADQVTAELGDPSDEPAEPTPEPEETMNPGMPGITTKPNENTMPGNPVVRNGVTTWDCIYFGNYYQQNGTTKEPIKWRVLSVDGNNAFLLADQNLDCRKYNDSKNSVTWKNCTLRSWLNGYGKESNQSKKDYQNNSFLKSAFSQEERSAIFRTKIKNGNNSYCGIKGEEQTTDRIYLLSISEASNAKYGFLSDFKVESETRIAANTAYVKIRNSAMSSAGKADWWWLRTPGDNSYRAVRLGNLGAGYYYGNSVETAYIAVRPALHLNLDSAVWKNAGNVSAQTGNSSQSVVKKNAKVQDGTGNTYIVTKSNSNRGEVAFALPKNKKVSKVIIPAAVSVQGTKYQVTGIKANAFKGCKKLQKVSIGKNVKSIGKKAFYGCSGLRKLVLYTKKLHLKNVGKQAFGKVNTKVKVNFPKKKKRVYQKMFKKRGLKGKAVKVQK